MKVVGIRKIIIKVKVVSIAIEEMVIMAARTDDRTTEGMMNTANPQPKRMLRNSASTSVTAVVHQSLSTRRRRSKMKSRRRKSQYELCQKWKRSLPNRKVICVKLLNWKNKNPMTIKNHIGVSTTTRMGMKVRKGETEAAIR